MISGIALFRDFVLIFLFGISVGFFFGWRWTRKHWRHRLAALSTSHHH